VYHTQLQFVQQSAGWSGTLSTAQWSDTKEQLRSSSGGQKRIVEKLWREFFSDPSQWWDHRSEKANTRYPDFKHKMTHESLWLNGKLNPSWVEAELAALVPGTVQMSLFSWNARLERCIKAGQYQKVVKLFLQMQQEGMVPNRFTFVQVLNACASSQALQEGTCIHSQIIQSGCESDVYVASGLINMYAKCGSIDDAARVFKNMATHDVVAWSTMILAHAKCGQGQKALTLFRRMQQEGVEPNSVTFVAALNACANIAAIDEGRDIHKQIIQSGYESNLFVGSSLVDMYAKCGSIVDAQRVFNKMTTHDVVSWSAMILGHVKCGQGEKALELFQQMQCEGVKPDHVTFVAVLNACTSLMALEEGRCVHEDIIQSDFEYHLFVGNSLVDMYAKCGSIEEAWSVFSKMPTRNVVTWNAMILGYVKCGQGHKALELSQQMKSKGVHPDPVTFVGLLNACASVVTLEEGRHVHVQIIESGCESDVFVASSLVDMYAKCGSMEDAEKVFNRISTRNVVAWNAMILGHIKCGEAQKALELYAQMQCEGVQSDHVTFVGALNACANLVALEEGRRVHEQVVWSGCESDIFVGSSLVDMYAKCGSIEDAKGVFNRMPAHDVVSWTAMLGGYAMHGHAEEALGHFERMCEEGVDINNFTFVSLLSACSHAGLVDEGLHYFQSMGLVYCTSATVQHYACVVDLLARAGCLEEAEDLIEMMSGEPDAAMWMSLLGACRVHANVEMRDGVGKVSS